MEIYIWKNEQQQGPYSIDDLNSLLGSEAITGDDLYWYEGCTDWVPISQLAGFVPPPSATPPPPKFPIAPALASSSSTPRKLTTAQKVAGVIVGVVVLVCMAVVLPGLKNLMQNGEVPNTQPAGEAAASNPAQENTPTQQSLPATSQISSLDDAKRLLVGTWTYTGQAMNNGVVAYWDKWVIKDDGTMDHYRASAVDDNWGTPEKETYKTITGKYSDTGERYYGIITLGSEGQETRDFSAVIRPDGSLIQSMIGDLTKGIPACTLRFERGDKNPFSK
jgi:hypothetical protein